MCCALDNTERPTRCKPRKPIAEFHKHVASCFKIAEEGSILKMPEEGQSVKFKNRRNKLQRPFWVVADTECTNVKTGRDVGKISKHVVNSCGYQFKCSFDPSRNFYKSFEGESCVVDMMRDLFELAEK
jgi:hypothetical protein